MRHLDDDDLDAIGVLLEERILHRLETIMATLQEVLDDETAEGGEISDLVNAFNAQNALIAQLNATIAGLQPGVLTPEQQATIDQIFSQAEANKATVLAALPATNPAPTPVPAPEPTPAPVFAGANVDAATGFVWKQTADETFEQSQARLVAFNETAGQNGTPQVAQPYPNDTEFAALVAS